VKNIFYRQCILHKELSSGGRRVQTSWIPEKYATVGKYLKLKDEDGWQVKSVGDEKRTQKEVLARSRDHLKQRQVSDV